MDRGDCRQGASVGEERVSHLSASMQACVRGVSSRASCDQAPRKPPFGASVTLAGSCAEGWLCYANGGLPEGYARAWGAGCVRCA